LRGSSLSAVITRRRRFLRAAPALATLAVALVLAGGCASETTDVSVGVSKINSQLLRGSGARLDCPKEVDDGKGARFDCTLVSSKTGKKRPVKMQITEQGGELTVDIVDAKAFEKALREVVAK
jgi:hypothetical protein